MPTKPYDELRKKLTPEQLAASAEKVEAMKIGMLIRQQRERAEFTQSELADRLGVSQQAISKFELGENIELPTLQRIFRALGSGLYLHTPEAQIPLPEVPVAGSS